MLTLASCREGEPLAKKIYKKIKELSKDGYLGNNIEVKKVEVKITDFANKEMVIKFNDSIRGDDVFIIQSFGSDPNKDLVELLLALDTAFVSSARRITLVLPIVYGSRQDRKSGARTTVTMATMAKLFKSVEVDRVVTASLHSPQSSAAFYAAGLKFDNLSTANIFLPIMKGMFNKENFVIVSPDVGGLQKARFYAKCLNADLAFADKRRTDTNKSQVLNFIGEVENRNCFIVDDMIDTAGSIVEVANELKKAGALKIHCLATHLVLSEPARKRIKNSPIEKVYGTDSIYHEFDDTYNVFSLDKLLGETILRVHKDISVGDLYENEKT